jgi:hypothetical protein
MTDKEVKLAIQSAIKDFSKETLTDRAIHLFKTLGYNTERQNPFPQKSYNFFKESFLDGDSRFNQEKALVKEWKSVDLLFQLTRDEVSDQKSIFGSGKVKWEGEDKETVIETYLFFAIELIKTDYSRSALAQITREINKIFPMPAMLLFKYGSDYLTLSVINRRLHKKDEQKDVLEKVTLIKDISIRNPHRAHLEILFDLSFDELKRLHKFTNFVELHNAWQKTLDTKELNKRFYRELSNWYFWAINYVSFPNDIDSDKDDTIFNSESIIRLLTRLIFIWFIKEKNLIPDKIFDEKEVLKLIKGFKTKGSTVYYRAILQNLFFATLNQKIEERAFATDGTFEQNKKNYGIKNLYRYSSDFVISKDEVIKLFERVPFLNGGLFDCLDSDDKNGKVMYLDGFSRNSKKQAQVPDELFFSKEKIIDLSTVYDDKKKKNETVKGLFEIFNHYKFTITENTPIEEEVALDPELLGRVFENLLASYNPETKTTARKQTGSFYTPREIVNYMVDESLKAYLKQKLVTEAGMKPEDAEVGLEFLLGYNEKDHLFDEEQTSVLINAIDNCKILDPACGSGAFPMGILHKLVYILHKLDPQNKLWEERQLEKVDNLIKEAGNINDSVIRDKIITDLQINKKDIEESFAHNELDYGRKLYLIENGIYGVDIQPIATQISKLRFFISLIVDQKVNKNKDNFGIRPLPNLETKFVAANTLIGINKPGGLLRNIELDKLEKILKDIRHRLFSAKNPATKRKLREEDQKLREEMGKILENSGWSNESAHQLAAWDPYNQNASSPFFDPEWMFGITEGFDVVIGNPPYIFSRENISHEEKNIYKTLYKLTQFKINMYILFIEKGYYLLKGNSGSLFFITPNNWLTLNTNSNLRKFLLINTGDIQILQNYANVFESASVDTVIVGFKKSSSHILKYLEWVDKKPTLKHVKDSSYYLNFKEYIISDMVDSLDSKHWSLKNEVKTLEEIAFVKNGVQAYTVGEGTPMCTKEMKEKRVYHSKIKKDNNWVKYLDGVDVSRYYSGWSGQFIKYGKNLSRSREVKLFIGKRILVRQIPSQLPYCLHACYVDEHAINDNNSMIIKVIDDERNLVKYILGVLNSSFISSWFAKKFGKLSRKIFPQFKVKELRTFPIPMVTIEIQRQFEKIVDCILFSKKNSQYSLDFIFFEHLVDTMVYELYFPNEIKAADSEVLKYLSNLPELVDDWSDEKKLEIIEKVYKEIFDPKHPVSIAMEKQKTVPEVRIIEGLPTLSEIEGDK